MGVSTGSSNQPATDAKSDVADVFISYASPDSAIGDAVCRALELHGVNCWIAPRDVVPGEFYADAIVRGIDAAKIVVLVLSQHAGASPHVVREIERATSKHHPILSFRVDRVAMPAALEYFLNTSHWLDASSAGVDASLSRLVDSVARLIKPGAAPVDPLGVQQGSPGRASTTPGSPAASRSIAVLPFANMSADPDQEYFSDGLAEEIINLLAHIPGLKVIARTSAFAFRGREQDIRAIAEALGVTHVLEGSVRRAGNRLRITGQLIHAADGSHLWSERYDRELSDIFVIQDEISTAIVGALRVKLSDEATPHRYAPNLAAYEAYLKARYLAARVTPESLQLARRCYTQAIELDGNFALAHIGMGHCRLSEMIFGQRAAHEGVPEVRADAHRALQIDPALAEAHALLGIVAAVYDFDWDMAERHFNSPLARQAGFATLRPMYGFVKFLRGDAEQAVELARRGIEEDPLDVWPRMNLHAYLQAAGRDSEALQQLEKVLELEEHQVVAMVSMAMIRADRGDLAEAVSIARRAHAIAPWYPDTTAVLAALARRSGDAATSESLRQEFGADGSPGHAHVRALFHLLSGEVDLGADWAEQAIEERDLAIMLYLRFVVSKGLRASHRWPKIAKMLKVPG
jgi:TolB-like protein/Tfp pilus assembly protein PilF